MRSRRRVLATSLLTAVLATGTVLLAPAAGAIVGGESVDPAAAGFVARIDVTRTATSTYTCTGSLVAPRLVLTAAHCLFSPRVGDWTVTFTGADPQTRGVVALVPYSSGAGAPDGRSTDDLAIVQLDRPVDRAPVTLDTTESAVVEAAPVVELGYGATTPNGTTEGGGRLRRAGQVLTERAATVVAAAPAAGGGIAPGSCADGDSGGPLVTAGDRPVLVGVVSTGVVGSSTCFSTRVDAGSPYRAWLDRLRIQPGSGTEAPVPAVPADPVPPITRAPDPVPIIVVFTGP